MDEMINEVPGASTVISWFGSWPSFHDAEVLSVRIERDQPSSVRVRTWTTSSRTDESGHFAREREATVVFQFSGIRSLRLEGEDADRQNVLGALSIEGDEGTGYTLDLGPSYGLFGRIEVDQLSVSIEHSP
jgi:hypothetical protein